jgi:Dyp-type peroxidase family
VVDKHCPIRETPPPPEIAAHTPDPSRQTVFPEPVIRVTNIQGAILPGFSKSHRILMFLRVHRKEHTAPASFRKWLKGQLRFIATADEVLAFNKLFKATRVRRQREGAVKSTWMGISLSFDLLRSLNKDADQFTDAAFRQGLSGRSPDLGDPITGPFSAANWLIGGPSNQADVVVIIEADDRADMLDEFLRVQETIVTANLEGSAHDDSRIDILFVDEGANLPGGLAGHEHFGFLDGVSQPGLRGLLSKDPTDVLTLRQNPGKRDQPEDPTKPASKDNKIQPAQGKPGQDLLYPGEFIFGYPRQIPTEDEKADGLNPNPGPDSLLGIDGKKRAAPDWARDGSFLVFRRLRQDVGGLHQFLHDAAQQLKIPDSPEASGAQLVGSKMVGRWPSGAPIQRTPGDDNVDLANDDCRNNNFEFQGDTEPIKPGPGDPSACSDRSPKLQSKADPDGARCPFTAHIRKAYPRDDGPRDPKKPPVSDPQLGEAATQTHRLLRRGLPYGPVSASTPAAPVFDDVDRGLQFIAFQTSIENQFEFVVKNWVNAAGFKEAFNPKPDGTPGYQGGGHDPIIGQNGQAGEDRVRKFTVTIPDPTAPDDSSKVKAVQLSADKDWVSPVGGGYFFTPSLEAIEKHLT